MRTRRSRTRALLLGALFVVAWFVTMAPPTLGGRTSYISVSGHSMEPTYRTGDLVVVREEGSYSPGDIVAFRAEGGIVIHRVIGGDGEQGYELQGDNNSWRDPWRPTDADVVGKARFRLPSATRWLLTLMHPAVLAGAMAVAVAVTYGPKKKKPTAPKGRPVDLETLPHRLAALPRRPLVVAIAAATVAVLLAVPTALAWADQTERTAFRETARYSQTTDFTYSYRLDRTTLYPTGTVGPVDASSPAPPKVFAKPAQALDVAIDYRFGGATDDAVRGTYRVDLIVSSEAGWEKSIPLVSNTPFNAPSVRIDAPVELPVIASLVQRINDETATSARAYKLVVRPTFEVEAAVGDTTVTATRATELAVSYDSATWTIASPLHDEAIEPIGTTVVDSVQLAGLPVSALRWLFVPVALLLVFAGLVVLRALRRFPPASIDAVLRQPGIDVIDLERPPADGELAVPLATPEGIRRVSTRRDGGLVLRYDDGTEVHLYARHDERIYSYQVATEQHR